MEENEQALSLSELTNVVRRRRGVIAITAGAIFLAAVSLASILPNEYESQATLLVEPQTISAKLVEATQGETDLNYRLNLMAAEILSRSRLSRIIDALDLYQEESEEMTREEIIEMMRDLINVAPVVAELEAENQNSREPVEINTFQVFFRHRSAKTAADVANRLANDFVEEHIQKRTRTSSDTSAFIEAELNRLARQIQELEERIATVKSANAGSLPDDLRSNQTVQERTYDELRAAQRTLAEAEGDVSFYKQQEISATTLLDPRDDSSPEQRLEFLELRISEFKSRGLTDKHPDVIATHQEIEEVRAALESRKSQDSEESRPPSVAQQNAAGERHRAELRVKATHAEIGRLQAQVDEFAEKIGKTPRVAEQLDALQREYKHLYASYQEFSGKRLEAAVAADMELQVKGERFRVLEAAVPALTATSPNRPLILGVGLMLGLALGGALAVMLEAADDSFRSARRLQSALRIPVLAAIPNILLERDRARIRRRQLRSLALASLVTFLVLTGSGVGYVWVNGMPAPLKSLLEGEPPAEADTAEQG
jgi:polysaccharide chain length determinant protein (PEP-CTERM system associated)